MTAIAIVGMGCRFPGGVAGPDAFWSLLAAGKSAIREIPPERWSLDGFYDPAPDNPFRSYSKWGGFLDDIASFDPDFFGLSRREAEAMDPQQRILLQVAYEAAQDARMPLQALAAAAHRRVHRRLQHRLRPAATVSSPASPTSRPAPAPR